MLDVGSLLLNEVRRVGCRKPIIGQTIEVIKKLSLLTAFHLRLHQPHINRHLILARCDLRVFAAPVHLRYTGQQRKKGGSQSAIVFFLVHNLQHALILLGEFIGLDVNWMFCRGFTLIAIHPISHRNRPQCRSLSHGCLFCEPSWRIPLRPSRRSRRRTSSPRRRRS